MLMRAALIALAVFWLAMNVLLWRSEFGPRNPVGSVVPVEAVWEKVLTAPDDSALEIVHHGKKIGFCHWAANLGQEQATGKTATEDVLPEGLVERLTSYRIDFEGTVEVSDLPHRLRFDLNAKFTTNHLWQELHLRVSLRPKVWELHTVAAEQVLRLKGEDGEGQFERVFRFADLQNPQALLQEFADPMSLALLSAAGLPASSGNVPAPALGLTWEARNDWLKIGHAPVRVYRLRARLLDRFQVAVFVSRVGEILRVELPDDLVLINDELTSL
jgi:hypothetical protein